MVGTYTLASFHISAGAGNTVEITDPPVVEQQPGNAAATIAGCVAIEPSQDKSREYQRRRAARHPRRRENLGC
jgi:hypothetical protein